MDAEGGIVCVLGSTTAPGRLRAALEQALAGSTPGGVSAALIDLGELEVPFADGRQPADIGGDTAAVAAAIAAADGVLFATPVYRGSLTGALKNLFDLLPVEALQGKAVGIVAMGASDHHFLGAERHLRDVLSFFGALVVPVAVYLTGADFLDGQPTAAAVEQIAGLLAGLAALARVTSAAGELGPAPLAARAIRR